MTVHFVERTPAVGYTNVLLGVSRMVFLKKMAICTPLNVLGS